MSSDETAPPRAERRAGRTIKSGSAERARLVVLTGEQIGRRFVLEDVETIGRSDEATIVFDDRELSRSHARIWREDRGPFFIEDLSSSNGTLLNGVPVGRARLAYGDKIQLGPNIVLMFSRYDLVEEQLLQRRKVELFGRLGAGVAHDLNNMLTVNATALRGIRDCAAQDNPELLEWLDDLEIATKQAAALVPRLLSCVGSRGLGERAEVDLSELCDEVCELARHAVDGRIHMERDVRPGLLVRGEADELHQALMNLCLNARDAMPDGGKLRVTARLASADRVAGLSLPVGGAFAEVTVTDAGVGMDVETRERIFEPFFTTKRQSGGLGLGLATLKETVHNHAGRVAVESELGRGSTFRIYLPVTRSQGRQLASHETVEGGAARRPVPSGTRVLVVDAEPILRRGWCRLLNRNGYVATEAASGGEALACCEPDGARPAVVIVDLDLSSVVGSPVHRQIRERHPEVGVLLTCAAADLARSADTLSKEATRLLPKPVSPRTLLAEVEHVLSVL